MRPSCCGCCPSCSSRCPRWAIPDKPKLVFFFDEAHLLFNDAPKALVDKVEQVARLIRSKGVGVYFITQNPADVPETILGQLGNRVQHALRAFTAKDQKDLRLAAETYRAQPALHDRRGDPRCRHRRGGDLVSARPRAFPAWSSARWSARRPRRSARSTRRSARALIAASPVAGKYDTADRPRHRLRAAAGPRRTGRGSRGGRRAGSPPKIRTASSDRPAAMTAARRNPPPKPAAKPAARRSDSVTEAFAKSFARQLGTKSGQALVRGVLGSLFKSR